MYKLMVINTRIEALKLLDSYFMDDLTNVTDRMEVLRKCNEIYDILLDNDKYRANKARNYEIESRLNEIKPEIFHVIDELCPINGFKITDDDGTYKGYKTGDMINI